MGKIPDLKRITKEDFPEQYRDLIEKLAFPLNSHMEQVRNLFNKNITFDNLAQDITTLSVQTGANGQPINKIEFKSTLNDRVKGLIPISANITSNNTSFVTQMPFISFTQDVNIVRITNIAGLSPETTYELTLLVIS